MKHKKKFLLGFFTIVAEVVTILGTPSLAPTTLTDPLDNSNVQISPTLAVILACLVLILFAGVFLYMRRMNPDSFDHSLGFHFLRHRPPVSRGLDPEIIKTFPIFVYSDVKALKLGKSNLECAVCLNEFEDEETLRLLPNCYHVFHPECIDAWLAFSTTCPVCRTNPAQDVSSVTSHPDTVVDIHMTAAATSVCPPDVINASSHHPSCSNTKSKTPNFARKSSTPGLTNIFEMFTRSHSTGHSLIQPGRNCESFTLRLPDDALTELSLLRTYNNEALPNNGRFKFLSTPNPLTKKPDSSSKD